MSHNAFTIYPNQQPELLFIGSKTVNEGELMQFTVTATDADEDTLTYSAGILPIGANFDPDSREFRWKPNYDQAGGYEVTFIVTDDGEPPLSDTETIIIEVINKRQPSSYGSYYGYGWYNWQLFIPQAELAWPNPSHLWQQQQQCLSQSFDLQSYKLSISQLYPLPQLQYPYWNFKDYQRQRSWNFQKSWVQPIFQLEPYLTSLSWDWYKQQQY